MDCKLTFIAGLCYFLILLGFAQKGENNCLKANAKSCAECIQAGPKCSWCKDLVFLGGGSPNSERCDDVAALLSKGCPEAEIENPSGQQVLLKNIQVTDRTKRIVHKRKTEDITQLQPQKLHLKLRLGEPQTITVKFKSVQDQRLDVYYLMRLFNSTEDDMENAKRLGTALLQEIQNLTSDFKIGFGAFVEKSGMPHSTGATLEEHMNPCVGDQNCPSCFNFEHLLSLTHNGIHFNNIVEEQHIFGNRKHSEGGLEAIMQVAVCREKIGWRNTPRLLIFSTNAGFNLTGDGKQDETLLPNDGQCHMEKNMQSTIPRYVYPSIVQLVQKLSENNIHTIFAVPEKLQPVYKELENLLPRSSVGILSENSSSVVQQIVNFYNSLSSEVILQHSKLPKGITVSSTSKCKNGVIGTDEDGRKCSNISIGDEVQFEITVNAHTCPKKQNQENKFKMFMLTYPQEEVEVILQFICDCDCRDERITESPHCNGGIMECGVCRCNEGRVGRHCECSTEEVHGDDLDALCRKGSGSEICSNRGECVCGHCVCIQRENVHEVYSGIFCECDNFSCDRSGGLICGGNGVCRCGTCECYPQNVGSACDCSLDYSTCVPSNGNICNGRGICECGSCKCTDPKYQGSTCENCPTCDLCGEHRECVQCRAFNRGEKKEVCATECMYFNFTMVGNRDKLPDLEEHFHCKEKGADGCYFYYTYSANEKNELYIHVVDIQGNGQEPGRGVECDENGSH